MKWKSPLISLVLTLTLLAGCASTPLETAVQTQDAYNGAVTVLIEARTVGVIDEETWQEEVLPLINAGDQALDLYKARIDAGLSGDSALRQVADVLTALTPFIRLAQRE